MDHCLPDTNDTVHRMPARYPIDALHCIALQYHSAYLTSGCFSPTRAGVFFVTRMDGVVDIWDYFYRQNEVAYSHKVGSCYIYNPHPFRVEYCGVYHLRLRSKRWGAGYKRLNEFAKITRVVFGSLELKKPTLCQVTSWATILVTFGQTDIHILSRFLSLPHVQLRLWLLKKRTDLVSMPGLTCPTLPLCAISGRGRPP